MDPPYAVASQYNHPFPPRSQYNRPPPQYNRPQLHYNQQRTHDRRDIRDIRRDIRDVRDIPPPPTGMTPKQPKEDLKYALEVCLLDADLSV